MGWCTTKTAHKIVDGTTVTSPIGLWSTVLKTQVELFVSLVFLEREMTLFGQEGGAGRDFATSDCTMKINVRGWCHTKHPSL